VFPSHFDFLRLQAIQAVLTHRRLIAAASLLLLDFFFATPPPSASLLSMLIPSPPPPPPCIDNDIWFASPISAIKVGLWKSLSLGFGLEHRQSYSSRAKRVECLRIESPTLYGFLRKAYRARIWCSGYQKVDFGAKVLVPLFRKVSSSAGGEKKNWRISPE
jgi:hypothetical protein